MGLRVCRLQRAVVAIGMFSLFESLLQDRMGWDNPFKELIPYLNNLSKTELAQTFEDYKNAINVLKHGNGPSYKRLQERRVSFESIDDVRKSLPSNVSFEPSIDSKDTLQEKIAPLEFKIKPSEEPFFEEGDVSEVKTLVNVDDRFVMRCAEIIEEIVQLLRLDEW